MTNLMNIGKMVTVMFESYPDVVTVKELCHMLQIGQNTAYNLLNSGCILSIRIGRKRLIPKAYVIEYIYMKIPFPD